MQVSVLGVRGSRLLGTLLGTRALHVTPENASARVAVVLSGCGVYDGTEIHEASAMLVHLSRAGAEVKMFAPDVAQMHVIDHNKGQPAEESRNVLVESARLARGDITALSQLKAQDHDAVIFPGGFGAAKNLLCCIAPVLAAKVLPGVEVTVGQEDEQGGKWPYAGTAKAISALGGKHCAKEVHEVHVDVKHRVVSTPAFMCNAPLHKIFDGIGAMVQGVLRLTGK
ncbi:glutamine amidotransferase-like class 1 domain-containing protein 3, mitochondrial isoform X2 [Bombina bombina]|uniref:glutamine amidotransferase-like class 1 domain-containing protein 3, mitochondrial isoform X2 n=1 Tax=Bombina bombina TaxID=8345 RepID=UPI00235AC9B6|nr:glutamine amidotransferase-like class 1 domain-containing protein 3, mitochondrial isoform X2 [Bombina bombina]